MSWRSWRRSSKRAGWLAQTSSPSMMRGRSGGKSAGGTAPDPRTASLVIFSSPAMPLLLNQAVVDVQYDRGATYFDKCGSLALKLQDQLGAAFEWSVPTVEFGQVQSPAERLVLRYSAKSFNVTQAWVSSVARVQHVAPPAWELVAETVGVSRTVTRCGVRFTLMWPTESLAIASTKISEARFWSASKDWASTGGDAACVASSTVLEAKRGKVRIA